MCIYYTYTKKRIRSKHIEVVKHVPMCLGTMGTYSVVPGNLPLFRYMYICIYIYVSV